MIIGAAHYSARHQLGHASLLCHQPRTKAKSLSLRSQNWPQARRDTNTAKQPIMNRRYATQLKAVEELL